MAHSMSPITVPERIGATILLALTVLIGLYPKLLLDASWHEPGFKLAIVWLAEPGRSAVSYLELLRVAAPETILVIAALAVLAVDLLVMREEPVRNRFQVAGAFAVFGCLAAAAWLLAMDQTGETGGQGAVLNLTGGMFMDDPLTRLVKVAILVLTIFTIVISVEGNFTRAMSANICRSFCWRRWGCCCWSARRTC